MDALKVYQDATWAHHLADCESEIERAFLRSYLQWLNRESMRAAVADEHNETVVGRSIDGAAQAVAGLLLEPLIERVDAVVIQAEVEGYRADFMVWRSVADPAGGNPFESPKVIVECDGHEFHDRTKEQVARDKGRDRRLQRNGYFVLRFPGSEIWKDAKRCAMEVSSFLAERCYEAAGKRHKFPV